MEPTRADIRARIAAEGCRPGVGLRGVLWRGRKGVKCFVRRRGERRFRERVCRAEACVIDWGDFSGVRRPGRRKARRK